MENFLHDYLKKMGERLRLARIEREDSQKDFAFRIGISIPTLHKMETGSPQVSIGTWVKAMDILGCAQDLEKLIAPKQSLAERFEAQQKVAGRQRVRKAK